MRTYEHANIIRDEIQFGVFEDVKSPEEELEDEMKRWLLGLPTKKKEKDFDDEELIDSVDEQTRKRGYCKIINGW